MIDSINPRFLKLMKTIGITVKLLIIITIEEVVEDVDFEHEPNRDKIFLSSLNKTKHNRHFAYIL